MIWLSGGYSWEMPGTVFIVGNLSSCVQYFSKQKLFPT